MSLLSKYACEREIDEADISELEILESQSKVFVFGNRAKTSWLGNMTYIR